MRSVSGHLRAVLAVVIGLAMSAAFAASPASSSPAARTGAPASEATWELADGVQRLCIPAEKPYWSYFIGFIRGHWDVPLTPTVTGFPEGTELGVVSSVPPGDNGDRSTATIWISVDLPPLERGEYPALLTVTDGTSTQTMDILVKAQERWGCEV